MSLEDRLSSKQKIILEKHRNGIKLTKKEENVFLTILLHPEVIKRADEIMKENSGYERYPLIERIRRAERVTSEDLNLTCTYVIPKTNY